VGGTIRRAGRGSSRNPLGRWDRWLYARAEFAEGSVPDRSATLLSAAADHSLLWVGIAGLLAATGGRFGRRAAVRGLLSVAITSAIANLPAKRLARRSRPVEMDGNPRRIWMIFIGNCRYRPSGFAPSWRERLDDGMLDVRTVDADEPWSRTRLIFALLSGRLGRCRVYHQRLVERIEFRSPDGRPIRLARDGETFHGSPEFVATKLPSPLPIYVPRAEGS
jgi:hypothetical protein